MELENKFYPVKNYEKYYSVNPITLEVYSVIKGRVLKGSIHKDKHGGYLGYCLKPNKKEKPIWKNLHRILVETFIPNPNNLPQVNHKNGNKLDNRLENLEWCTQSYNTKEAYRLGLIQLTEKQKMALVNYWKTDEAKATQKKLIKKIQPLATAKAKEINSIKTRTYENGKELNFDSIRDLAKYIGVSNTAISEAFKKGRQYVKGYKIEKVS